MERSGTKQRWLTIKQVSEDRNVHYDTVLRWIRVGVLGVRLRTESRGYSRVTTEEWLEDFDQAITDVRESRRTGISVVASTSRKRVNGAVTARLRAKHGI